MERYDFRVSENSPDLAEDLPEAGQNPQPAERTAHKTVSCLDSSPQILTQILLRWSGAIPRQ